MLPELWPHVPHVYPRSRSMCFEHGPQSPTSAVFRLPRPNVLSYSPLQSRRSPLQTLPALTFPRSYPGRFSLHTQILPSPTHQRPLFPGLSVAPPEKIEFFCDFSFPGVRYFKFRARGLLVGRVCRQLPGCASVVRSRATSFRAPRLFCNTVRRRRRSWVAVCSLAAALACAVLSRALGLSVSLAPATCFCPKFSLGSPLAFLCFCQKFILGSPPATVLLSGW